MGRGAERGGAAPATVLRRHEDRMRVSRLGGRTSTSSCGTNPFRRRGDAVCAAGDREGGATPGTLTAPPRGPPGALVVVVDGSWRTLPTASPTMRPMSTRSSGGTGPQPPPLATTRANQNRFLVAETTAFWPRWNIKGDSALASLVVFDAGNHLAAATLAKADIAKALTQVWGVRRAGGVDCLRRGPCGRVGADGPHLPADAGFAARPAAASPTLPTASSGHTTRSDRPRPDICAAGASPLPRADGWGTGRAGHCRGRRRRRTSSAATSAAEPPGAGNRRRPAAAVGPRRATFSTPRRRRLGPGACRLPAGWRHRCGVGPAQDARRRVACALSVSPDPRACPVAAPPRFALARPDPYTIPDVDGHPRRGGDSSPRSARTCSSSSTSRSPRSRPTVSRLDAAAIRRQRGRLYQRPCRTHFAHRAD